MADMSNIPIELKATPVSRGIYISLISWLMGTLACIGAFFGNEYIAIFALITPLIDVVSFVWTGIETVQGKRWALPGFVLSIALPVALWVMVALYNASKPVIIPH